MPTAEETSPYYRNSDFLGFVPKGLAVSFCALMLVGCSDYQPARNNSADSNPLCRMLPGKSESIRSTKSGIQYLPPSFGKIMHICAFRGYPECFPKINQLENEWYSKHWEAAREKSVYEISRDKQSTQRTVIRFTWLPTFDHPVIVRFEMSSGSATLVAKELSGAGGYDPGSINRQITRQLNQAELSQVIEAMTRASPFSEPPLNCQLGVDGSEWILERSEGGRYKYATRWSPEKGSMRDFGLLALKMTGWNFARIY